MSYDLYDFKESLSVAGVADNRVEHCSLGFGDSPEGGGSWEGGFVCHTRSGKPWLFVFGWCDYTGWGCQDGAWVEEFDKEPTRDEIKEAWLAQMGDSIHTLLAAADESPVDVNRYLRGEIDAFGTAVSGSTDG